MNSLKFRKMHGLGNDFMVIDAVRQAFDPAAAPIAAWADRYTGVGFDQLLVVEKPHNEACDFRYRIFNADGSEVEQCGNGARCFVRFVQSEGLTDKEHIVVETMAGVIMLHSLADGLVTVQMGQPRFLPEEIPFTPAYGEDPAALTHILVVGTESVPVTCVNMHNPHAVIVVDDTAAARVGELGRLIESHVQFPKRVNVGFMQVLNRGEIRLRVYERGAGETQACGTGACAAVVAGVRQGLLDRKVTVHLQGGDLLIEWPQDEPVMMTGPATTVYSGEISW